MNIEVSNQFGCHLKYPNKIEKIPEKIIFCSRIELLPGTYYFFTRDLIKNVPGKNNKYTSTISTISYNVVCIYVLCNYVVCNYVVTLSALDGLYCTDGERDSFGKSKHRLFYFVSFKMSQVLDFYDSSAKPIVKRKIRRLEYVNIKEFDSVSARFTYMPKDLDAAFMSANLRMP